MTRVLPAHVVAGALVLGLACSDLVRPGLGTTATLLAVGATAVGLAAPRPARLGLVALLVAAAGWWWGGVRLHQLDRSPLRAEVERSAIESFDRLCKRYRRPDHKEV